MVHDAFPPFPTKKKKDYRPLFFNEHSLTVITTPLNMLRMQMQKQLGRHKIETIHFYNT